MYNILAIDDNETNLFLIKKILYHYLSDCNILTALSGKEGIKIAKEKLPDTILLDICMPEMDGFEVCKILLFSSFGSPKLIFYIKSIKNFFLFKIFSHNNFNILF